MLEPFAANMTGTSDKMMGMQQLHLCGHGIFAEVSCAILLPGGVHTLLRDDGHLQMGSLCRVRESVCCKCIAQAAGSEQGTQTTHHLVAGLLRE